MLHQATKVLHPIVLFLLLGTANVGCKIRSTNTNPQKNAQNSQTLNYALTPSDTTVVTGISQPSSDIAFTTSVAAVENEPNLNIETEFKQYKEAIAAYKKTPDYLSSTTDEDKTFNAMVDQADLMTKSDLIAFMQAGKFTQIQHRMNTQLPEIAAKAKELITKANSTTTTNTSTSTPAPIPTKTTLQQNTGIWFITMACLATAGGAAIGAKLPDLKNAAVQKSKVRISDRIRGGLAGAGVGLALTLWPLVVGSLIVSKDSPDRTVIQAAQGFQGLIMALPILSTLVFGVASVALYALPENLITQKSTNPTDAKNIHSDFIRGRYALVAGTLISLGATVGLGIWTNKLGLAEDRSPKEIVAASIARLGIAARILEARGSN